MAIHDESFCKMRAADMRALADQALSSNLRKDFLTMSKEWQALARLAQGLEGPTSRSGPDQRNTSN